MQQPINQAGNMESYKQQVKNYCQSGEFSKAYETLNKLEEIKLMDAELYYLHGSVCGRLGRFEEAISHYNKAIELQPNAVEVHLGLGHALDVTGKIAEAEVSFKTFLESQPDNPQANLELGIVLFKLNKFDEAEQCFIKVLAVQPESIKALWGLGRIYHVLRQPEVAKNYLNRALEINPKHPGVHYQLGSIAREQGQLDIAEKEFSIALEIYPSYVDVLKELGNMHMMLNRPEESKRTFERILSFEPGNIDAIIGIAKLHDQMGDVQSSFDTLTPLLEKGIKSVNLGVAFGNVCRHFGNCQEAADYLEELLAHYRDSAARSEQIHFALGGIYDRLGEYDKAFTHYNQGNLEKSAVFNKIEHAACIDKLIATCDWNFFINAPRASQTSTRPVFIVGMPRSGTTLTEQILSSHPNVFGAGEITTFPDIIKNLSSYLGQGAIYPDNLRNLTPEILDSLSNTYLQGINTINSQTPRFTDKTLANYLYLGLISLMFPNARIIHCMRDPRDTCLSIYFQNFDDSHNYATRLENLGCYYNEYKKLMAHWKSMLNIPIMEVQYEELVDNQERVSRELIDFVGLEWDERVLRFYESKRSVVTASYDQVRQKIYTRSTQRWKNYEKHIGPLLKALEL